MTVVVVAGRAVAAAVVVAVVVVVVVVVVARQYRVSVTRERDTRGKFHGLPLHPCGFSQLWHRRGYAEEAAEVVSAHGFTIRFYLTTDGNILSRGSSRINRPLCEDTTRRCVDGSVCYLRRTTGLRVRSPFPLGARPSPCSPFPLSPFPLPLWACPCPFPSELALSPFLPQKVGGYYHHRRKSLSRILIAMPIAPLFGIGAASSLGAGDPVALGADARWVSRPMRAVACWMLMGTVLVVEGVHCSSRCTFWGGRETRCSSGSWASLFHRHCWFMLWFIRNHNPSRGHVGGIIGISV